MFCVCLFSPLCKSKGQKLVLMSTIFEENLASTRFGFNCLIMRRFFDSLSFSRIERLFIHSRRLDDDFVLYIRERCFLPFFFFFHSLHDHSFMSLGRAYPCGKSIQRPAESITALFHPLFNLFSHHPKWGATDVIHRPDHQHQKKNYNLSGWKTYFLLEI